MLHIQPTNCLLLTTKQEPYKKSLSLNKKYWRIFWKKFRRKGQQAENDKTERVTGLGRRTREEIAKWNQMAALSFQRGGRHQTSPASLRGTAKKSPLRNQCPLSLTTKFESWWIRPELLFYESWRTKPLEKHCLYSNYIWRVKVKQSRIIVHCDDKQCQSFCGFMSHEGQSYSKSNVY